MILWSFIFIESLQWNTTCFILIFVLAHTSHFCIRSVFRCFFSSTSFLFTALCFEKLNSCFNHSFTIPPNDTQIHTHTHTWHSFVVLWPTCQRYFHHEPIPLAWMVCTRIVCSGNERRRSKQKKLNIKLNV